MEPDDNIWTVARFLEGSHSARAIYEAAEHMASSLGPMGVRVSKSQGPRCRGAAVDARGLCCGRLRRHLYALPAAAGSRRWCHKHIAATGCRLPAAEPRCLRCGHELLGSSALSSRGLWLLA